MTDSTSRPDPRQVRRLVAGLVLLAVASLLPDFRSSVIPRHDARQCLNALQILTSALRAEGEIPHWIPYGRYGNPGFLVMLNVTPAGWAAALAGTLIPVGSIVLLKIQVLVELLILLAGSIRLSLQLFRGLAAVALVNIGVILSFSWVSSFDANLHTFYLMPFILDALLRFGRNGRLGWLLAAVLFCVVSAIGNVPYYPPMMALMLTLFSAVLLWSRGFKLPPVRVEKADLLLLLPIAVLATAHVAGYVANFRDQHTYTIGRDPVSGKALMHFYLEYNGTSTVPNLATAFVTGAHTQGDVTFYIGLVPLALAFFGLTRCRRGEFLAVAAVAGFLVLFSFGGIVARAAYYFPGMSYYRHISLVLGPAKLLILLMAGFGLEALFLPPMPEAARRGGRVLLALAVLLTVAELGWSLVRVVHPWNFLLLPVGIDVPGSVWIFPMVRAAVAGALVAVAVRTAKFTPATALLAALLLDLGSFKILQSVNWPPETPEEVALAREVYTPQPLPWRPQRTSSELERGRSPRFRTAVEDGVNACVYSHVYAVLGVDPRMPVYRVDTLTTGLDALFRARNVELRQFPSDDLLSANDGWLLDALGARQPKLRVCAAADLELSGSADAVRAIPRDARFGPAGSVTVTSFGFNHLAVEATVDGAAPAWLYYADAAHAGWSATVDGRPAAISTANLAFKAVPLHPGRNTVEFRYGTGAGSLCLPVLAGGSVLALIGLAVYLLRSPASAGT